MAYVTGTASDYSDLWNKLILFLTGDPDLIADGQAWEVVWEADPGFENESDIVIKGPGMNGDEKILVGLRRESDYTRNSFLFRMAGMTGLREDATAFNDHINPSSDVVMYVDQNPMTYWFVANGRRFVVVVKVSTVYQTLYGGFYLPYCDPLSYPYPLAIGGSAGPFFNLSLNWTNTSPGHSHFMMPYGADSSGMSRQPSLYFCDPSAQWVEVDNGNLAVATEGASVGPWKWNGGSGVTMSDNIVISPISLLRSLGQCLGGEFTLQPATIVQNYPTDQTWGIFDGVYHVPGHNNAAENIITVNGVDHLVVQNVYRTTSDNYWALALE